MRNLIMPEIDDLTLWKNIVLKKRLKVRNELLSLESSIKDKYNYYLSNSENLESIKPSNDDDILKRKDDLKSCYGNNVSFLPIKKQLLSLSHKCPYCLVNRPNTLDHYFDKSDYPEYSVFVPNLIPCCSKCNTEKGALVIDENGHRHFIHYYYDLIPKYQFLFVRFDFNEDDYGKIPLINVYLDFKENNATTEIICRHFKKLQLIERYKESIKNKLPVLLSEIEIYKGILGTNEIKLILETRYNNLIQHQGINYWETCIYEGLLINKHFLC